MSYVVPFSTKSVIVPTGQYIAIASIGEGQTEVYIEDSVQTSKNNATLAGLINDSFKTFGTYTRDKKVTIISYGANVEYAVGSNPAIKTHANTCFNSFSTLTVTAPAATFTSPVISNNGSGKTVLTSVGVHGLTAAVAVNKYIYVTWASGTGVSGFFKVLALDLDSLGTAITIDLAYSAGLGTPTVKLAGNAITLATDVIPAYTMKIGSVATSEILLSCTASTNAKTLTVTYGGVSLISYSIPSNQASILTHKRICQCSMSQILTNASNAIGFGVSTASAVRDTVDATVNNNFVISVTLSTANEFITLEGYRTEITY